jgi:hypothetical protein
LLAWLAFLFGEQPKEKTLSASFVGCRDFFFVDKRVEISNLLWDMAMIIKLADYSG